MTLPSSLADRLARIHEECMTPLGYGQRGVASWDQARLLEWRHRTLPLSAQEEAILQRIEKQVFG